MNKQKRLEEYRDSINQAGSPEILINLMKAYALDLNVPHSEVFNTFKEEVLSAVDLEPEEYDLDEIAKALDLDLEKTGNDLKAIDNLSRQISLIENSKVKFKYNDFRLALDKHDFNAYGDLTKEQVLVKIKNAESSSEVMLLANAFAYKEIKKDINNELPDEYEIKQYIDDNFTLEQLGYEDNDEYNADFEFYIEKSTSYKEIFNISEIDYAIAMQQDTTETILENLELNGMSNELTAMNLFNLDFMTNDYTVDSMVELTDAEIKAHYLALSDDEKEKFQDLVADDDDFNKRFNNDAKAFFENVDLAYEIYVEEYNPKIDTPVYANGTVIGGYSNLQKAKNSEALDEAQEVIDEIENAQNPVHRQNENSLLGILKRACKDKKNEIINKRYLKDEMNLERAKLINDKIEEYTNNGYIFGAIQTKDNLGNVVGVHTPNTTSCKVGTPANSVAAAIVAHYKKKPNKFTVIQLNDTSNQMELAQKYLPDLVRQGLIDVDKLHITPRSARRAFNMALQNGVAIKNVNKIDAENDDESLSGPDNVNDTTESKPDNSNKEQKETHKQSNTDTGSEKKDQKATNEEAKTDAETKKKAQSEVKGEEVADEKAKAEQQVNNNTDSAESSSDQGSTGKDEAKDNEEAEAKDKVESKSNTLPVEEEEDFDLDLDDEEPNYDDIAHALYSEEEIEVMKKNVAASGYKPETPVFNDEIEAKAAAVDEWSTDFDMDAEKPDVNEVGNKLKEVADSINDDKQTKNNLKNSNKNKI